MGLFFQQKKTEALGRNRPKRCLGSATGKDQRGGNAKRVGFLECFLSFGAVREIGGDKDGWIEFAFSNAFNNGFVYIYI